MTSSVPSEPPPPPPPPPDAGVAATFTDCAAEPPAPVQVSDRVAVLVISTARLPLVGSLPVQPEAPAAVHEVAYWLLHVRVTVPPVPTDEALALRLTVGAAEAILTLYKP